MLSVALKLDDYNTATRTLAFEKRFTYYSNVMIFSMFWLVILYTIHILLSLCIQYMDLIAIFCKSLQSYQTSNNNQDKRKKYLPTSTFQRKGQRLCIYSPFTQPTNARKAYTKQRQCKSNWTSRKKTRNRCTEPVIVSAFHPMSRKAIDPHTIAAFPGTWEMDCRIQGSPND